jgi:hypothetical protein
MSVPFDQFIGELYADRLSWIEASRKNKFERGIWNATVEKYADPTHFIFELLQNAEDQGATWVRFRLERDTIAFEHDGTPFDRDDIEGITGIGNTTKIDQPNKIGCFGIGFKSVYVVTQRPEIHCAIEGNPIAFAIRDLVIPELIATSHNGPTTLIRLPLVEAKAAEILGKVREGLGNLGPRSLLFLNKVKSLHWSDGETDGHCSVEAMTDGIRALVRVVGAEAPKSERFLILSRPVARDGDARDYSVKIALKLDDRDEIVAEPVTRLAVFFETEDLTGLRFQVHGPFQLTDNRANIKRGDPWNLQLVQELSALLVESLPELRDRGYLKRNFLEVMPNKHDDLPEPWPLLRQAVVDAFKSEPLVPAHHGGHVPGTQSIRGPSDVRDVLGDDGLVQFADLGTKRWVVSSGLKHSRADGFLATIDVPEWAHAEFLTALQRGFTPNFYGQETASAKRAQSWFDALTDDQVQRFYLLIDAAARSGKRPGLSQIPYVRLEDGTRASSTNARLRPPGGTDEAAAHGLVLVKRTLTRIGRGRGKDVEQFLRKVGVKEIGERDYLAAIIRANYAGKGGRPTVERHLQHMRRVLRYFAQTHDITIFQNADILRAEGTETYHKPSDIFLGMPFAETGLDRIYDGTLSGRNKRPLWKGYAKLKRPDLLAFVKAIGLEDELVIERTRIPYDYPRWGNLHKGFGGTRTMASETNTDYRIAQLAALLKRKDVAIARMVWNAVATVGLPAMFARWAPNQQYAANRDSSTLAIILQQAEWIPTADGAFRRPRVINGPDLLPGFTTAGNETWLEAIEFGLENRQRSELGQMRRKAAQSIGLPPELADQLGRLPADAVKALADEMLDRINSGAFSKPDFPERTAPNPAVRAERVAERAKAAPIKTYETRERSVRTSDTEVKPLAKTYLRDYYTNDREALVCQGCHDVMPFRVPSGEYYFEAPELLQSTSSELAANHLALCPTCSAKWRYANETEDADIVAALRENAALDISVILAGETVRLRFVQVHFDDLRAIIGLNNCVTEDPDPEVRERAVG